jgi:pimeloyl-ACP methyl ester carboxylesterase
MIDFRTAELAGLRMHYAEAAGPGQPLVLVHGILSSLTSYLPLMPHLAVIAHVYALDLRGHGHSDRVAPPYVVSAFADDLAGFIRAVIGRPAIIAGHSLGALVAARVAAYHPDAVSGVLLEDPPIYMTLRPRFKETVFYDYFVAVHDVLQSHTQTGGSVDDLIDIIGQWPIADGRTGIEAFGREALREWATNLHLVDPRILGDTLEGELFDAPGPDAVLDMIRCPAHVLIGQWSLGAALDDADLRRMLARLPQATYRVFEDVGHLIHVERQGEYLAELRQFVAQVSRYGG